MARVKVTAPLSGIRGKLGGMVFSQNGSGAYAKRWSRPIRQTNPHQSILRSRLSNIYADWAALSQSQIDAWNAFAASPPETDYDPWGSQRYLSGCQWHTRINLRRLQCGQAIASAAPTATPVSPPDHLTLTVYETAYGSRVDTFAYQTDDFSGFYAILHCAAAFSPVLQSFTRTHRAIWNGSVSGASQTTITTEIEAALGTLITDQKIFGQLYKQSTDGIRSTPVLDSTLVLATP